MPEQEPERHVYKHEPLRGPSWTRVIKLSPGNFNDPIECTLKPINLDSDHEPYVALSYQWGDPKDITTITCGSQSVSVTRKLFDAVRSLRQRKSWLTFWADALSIDQSPTPDGLEEKNAQVQLMSVIFPRATEVVVDLGHSDEHTGAAIDLMDKLSRLPENLVDQGILLRPYFQSYGIPDLDHPAWEAWMNLTRREWFNRVWMIQEFALARRVKMMIGPYVFEGVLLQKAHRISSSVQPPTAALLDSLRSSERSMRGLPVMSLMSKMYKVRDTLRLADVFGMCSSFLATDKRDHIYALRGLLKNDLPSEGDPSATGESFQVDYREGSELLAVRFASYLACRHPSSLMWMFAGGPHSQRPSWAPSLETNSLRVPTEGVLPNFEDQPVLFSAAGKTRAKYDFEVRDGNMVLRTKGCVVDTIKAMTPVYDIGIADSTLSAGDMGTKIVSFEHQARSMLVEQRFPTPFSEIDGQCSEAYWRTLVSDSAEHGQKRAPASLVDNFRAFATVSNMVEDGRTKGDIDNDPEQMSLVIQMTPFMFAFSIAMLERKVCITEADRVGNVVEGAKVGDKVVIILGVEKPLIMRSVGSGSDLEYIGIGYIHGIMDGELVNGESWKVQELRVV